jgi:hypothetical protein
MGASHMVVINITIRVNGFMAIPPIVCAAFYTRYDTRSTLAKMVGVTKKAGRRI